MLTTITAPSPSIAGSAAKTKQRESMNTKNETPVLIENPNTYRFAGGRTQVLLSGEQTDGAFATLLMLLELGY